MANLLDEAHATLGELIRIHNLSQELLETLSVTALWLRDYAEKQGIPLPNISTYNSLIRKAEILIQEISVKNPIELSRRKVTAFRTDEEVPEPARTLFKLFKTGL